MRASNLVLLAILFLMNSFSRGQVLSENIKFRRLEANKRLSHQNINAILQDSFGFLWIGTDDGLNRFDGYDFKIYRNQPNDSASLAQNKVQSIFEDSEGKLWVSTINTGLHYYDRDMDVFVRVPEWTNAHCQVMQIVEDEHKQLWIAGGVESYAFVASLDRRSLQWKKYLLMPASIPIDAILPTSGGNFWIGMQENKGLFKWNSKTGVLEKISTNIIGKNIEKLIQDDKGNIWIGTRSGLTKFDAQNQRFQKVYFDSEDKDSPKNDIPALDLCIDGQYLWVAKENGGLSRFHLPSNTVQNFLYDRYDPYTIVSNSIWSLHKDRQGRIWIGSFAAGLCVLDKLEQRFQVLTPYQNELVNDIVEDSKGRLWIATEDGAIMHDKDAKYRFRNKVNDPSSISSNAVLCFFEDSRKQMWIGCWNGGVNRHNEDANTFTRFLPDPSGRLGSMTNPNVFAIGENSLTGDLLVGTFGGLNILKDQSRQKFDYLYDNIKEGDVLINAILEDSKRNIWIGSYSGLNLYDLNAKRIAKIPLNTDSTLTSYRVNSIFESSRGEIWVGSHGGLHKVINNKVINTYNTSSGLPSDIVECISEDGNNNLWIGTTKGLIKYNPEKNSFRVYNETDGLLSDNIKTMLRSSSGLFYVGGKGINVFNPDSLRDNDHKPEVYITEIKLFNRTVDPNDETQILKSSILNSKTITLNHSQAFITLQYIGINFTATHKNQYAYKLVGFDDDWNYVGEKREVTFTNLLPGTYFFKVKACNNDGLWNDEGKTLEIIVLPPWWVTIWFRGLTFLVVVSGSIAFYYYRIRNIKIQNIKLEQLVEQRTSELKRLNGELAQTEKEIKAKNEELMIAQEETSTQRDQLEEQNKHLQDARKEIEMKNLEIMRKNETLEEEVNNRTRELMSNVQQLEQFAFMAAHNLRGPVARILGLGEILKYAQTKEEALDVQSRIIRTTQELDTVVRDLNHVLEIRTNTSAVSTTIEFSEEMKFVKNILQNEIESTGAYLSEDFSAVNEVRSVKSYFESILTALLSNALKFRHPDRVPEIFVQSGFDDHFVYISIRDNGLGLDVAQNKQKLFKFYSRFHSNVSGKGVGLFTVKTLLEALGGQIEITPNEIYGVTVKVDFPRKSA